ncbi:citrate synthase [Rhizobiales bacterium GAS191]|nr:citrate synthase [Rhizobiales bacterium GAS191]
MKSGLDDVVAAETVLSDVDGNAGRLIIRGASLDDLVRSNRYEDVLALLLAGFIENLPEPGRIAAALGAARTEVFAHLQAADTEVLKSKPIEAVRALLARIADSEDVATALRLIAAPAVFTPGITRLQRGLEPIAPDPALSHAADILRMTHDCLPSAEQIAALDTYLVTVSDHGLNASTFAARVVASTHAGLTSAVLAALSALKGPLHGGAPGPVLDMLDAIGRPEDAETWLEAALARHERLMGFGHRIYRVRDPRADALKAVVRNLVEAGQVDSRRMALGEAVEAAALSILKRKKPDRPLQTNVEFYTALLLEALGFTRDTFTCVFAIGRVGGWIGHAREQVLEGRLIRPQSRYVGPQPQQAA